ncbi:DNA polymerase III subunit gamma/tau [Phormidesmis priestleyi ULC007]|uniref:DNA polymerase III subunit gamma/tau n=1 Tax=Phormidesmis priestleyi ULC007 TaxID=1920490 RepID=A0A2T1D7R7_9CYAN|nr:DNA polymerase III subunit gamma/tau [Phormidesmis priestleyi]PSB16484.1 DNA polymerase III subunit gamma/tau [Phormidesmis priestleyi ULC007]PZO48575.1 MAG: DNA polymerase III subunit gamma/tau [Phormidesmis priestleyi]
MSYQPLHHKYRPQTFAQLVGQEAIATTLSNALCQQRIAPAYLFTGARGTGKTSSARIFAKSLNCIAVNAPTDAPCGVCETCRAITNGSALDVIEIDAASNTGVDNIRELIERAQFAPVQCRYKVYVIDEVHMLSNAAFNALLKTLEEPPDRVVFILATTDPQRVLPTIISRCQRFDYRRIPLEPMVQHLGMIAEKESISIAKDALHLIAQISQGGLRDAESLLDQLSLLAGEVTVDRVWDLVGAVPEQDLMGLVEAIATSNPEAVLDHTRRLMDRGREPLIVLQNLASFYRDLLIAKTAPTRSDLVAITPPTWKNLCNFAQTQDLGTILAGQQHLRSSELQLKNTTQPRLWLELTLLGLLPTAIGQPILSQPTIAPTAPEVPVFKPAVKEVTSTPQPLSEPAIAPQVIEDVVAAPQPSDANDELAQTWQQILSYVDIPSTKGIVSANCHLLAVNGNEVIVGVRGESMVKMIQRTVPLLGRASARALKRAVKVTLQVSEVIASNSAWSMEQPNPSASRPIESSPQPPEVPAPAIVLQASESSEPTPLAQPEAAENPDLAQARGWEDDEVTKAAKSLAYAFNGDVVNLDDELDVPIDSESIAIIPPVAETFEPQEEPEEDDEEDVDF